MHKLSNGGRINLSECFEKIVDKFCEEQVIEERTSFDNIKYRFHHDLNGNFLCNVPTLLFKFLIDKAMAHIFKPQLVLAIHYYIDWSQRKREWEKLIKEQQWDSS